MLWIVTGLITRDREILSAIRASDERRDGSTTAENLLHAAHTQVCICVRSLKGVTLR